MVRNLPNTRAGSRVLSSSATAAASGRGLRRATLQLHNVRKRYSSVDVIVDVINDPGPRISEDEFIVFNTPKSQWLPA